jgi:hypothetical protein
MRQCIKKCHGGLVAEKNAQKKKEQENVPSRA